MKGLEIEAIYEHGTLKLPRELPLQEGQKVTITIHAGSGAAERLYGLVPWTGDLDEFDRWLNDPDEGVFGWHGDDLMLDKPIAPGPICVVFADATKSKSSVEHE